MSGIFYAEPVTIDSEDSDDEEDEDDDVTDDAATVIFKPSPYSSPAPGQWGSWSFSERFGWLGQESVLIKGGNNIMYRCIHLLYKPL